MMVNGIQQFSKLGAPMGPAWVDLCGNMAPTLSMMMFAAPLPTIREIHENKSVGDYPLLPYSSMVTSTSLGCVYGYLKAEPKIWTSNAVGLVLAVAYCFIYVKNLPKSTTTLPGHVRQQFAGVASIIFLALFLAARNSTNLVGLLGITICIAMFGSPLSQLSQVIRDRSAASIPLTFAIVSGLNCLSWCVTGWWGMGQDLNVVIPNIFGLFFALAQLTLKVVYGNGCSSEEKVKLSM